MLKTAFSFTSDFASHKIHEQQNSPLGRDGGWIVRDHRGKQARFVIDTVYEWMEYIHQDQETHQHQEDRSSKQMEILGRFIQASTRLERVIYTAIQKYNPEEELSRRRVYPISALLPILCQGNKMFSRGNDRRHHTKVQPITQAVRHFPCKQRIFYGIT